MKRRVSVTRIVPLLVVVTFGLTSLFAQEKNPDRNAYFGETHIHTSWSFDAYVFGNTKAGPEESYKFATCCPSTILPGYKHQNRLSARLHGGIDHAEYVGTVPLANDPNSPISKLPLSRKTESPEAKKTLTASTCFCMGLSQERTHSELANWRSRATSGSSSSQSRTSISRGSSRLIFGFKEWTSTPDNRNMHRNIIFKDSKKGGSLYCLDLSSWRTSGTGWISAPGGQ